MTEYTTYNATTGEIVSTGVMQIAAVTRFNRPGLILYLGARLSPDEWRFENGQPVRKAA